MVLFNISFVMMSDCVAPRVSALAGCDRLVSEPKVIENAGFSKVKIATITNITFS